MKGSGIKDLCHRVAWKTSPKHCCSIGKRYSGTYCLFNQGLYFLELYAVKNHPLFLVCMCRILYGELEPFYFFY